MLILKIKKKYFNIKNILKNNTRKEDTGWRIKS
jgi:hypothetical protein